MEETRIFAYQHENHDAYWCSQACKDEECEFGPCCEPKKVRAMPYDGEIDVI